MLSKIKTICGDSLKGLPQMPDNYFDLVLTDPPYNLGKDYGDKVNDSLSYDEYLNFSKEWFTQAKRVATAVVFTPGWNQLKMWLTEIEFPKGIVIWYNKNQMSHSNLGGWNHYEPILVYGKIHFGKNVLNIPVSVQTRFKVPFKTTHPNPKPVELMKAILKTTTIGRNKIKRVLDPFMGVGSTLMACKKLNINCLGIEINDKFVKEANRYLELTSHGDNAIENFLDW